jgi:hypothetical protein
MVERICPQCASSNPAIQPYCGQCGTALEQLLARRAAHPLARRLSNLPAHWKQTGKVVALGVATLAAEAGMAWLQNRQQQVHRRQSSPADSARVIALGRRVSERWQNGVLQERIEERVVWIQPDKSQL